MVMKRKRGRPKGSTKKPSAEEELAENIVSPTEDSPPAAEEGGSLAPSSLECSKCCRKFSNTRQLRKHICIIVLNLGEEEGEAGTCCQRAEHVTFLWRGVATNISFLLVWLLLRNSTYLYRSHPCGKVLIFLVIVITVSHL